MPRWLHQVSIALRRLVGQRSADRDLDDELRFHVEREIQVRVDAGHSPADARRAAMRAMGPLEANRERCRDLRPGHRVRVVTEHATRDLLFALRLLHKHPVPSGIAIGGLAIALGVVTSVFTIVNATMLRPYGVADPSSVVDVAREGGWPIWSYRDFVHLQRGSTTGSLEAAIGGRVRFSDDATGDGLARQRALFVTGGYLSLFGARPALGRTLGPADDQPDAPPAIVVSDHFWRTHLSADPQVVGRTVWVNDAPVTLAGVLEPGFTGPRRSALAIWATFASYDDLGMGPEATPDSGPEVEVVGRLAPGVAHAAMQANLVTVRETPDDPHRRERERLEVRRASSPVAGSDDVESYIVLALVAGLVGIVLALACTNLANLQMASTAIRTREISVRLAMGASRRRLVAQLVTESVLGASLAGVLGLLFSFWLTPIFATLIDARPENGLVPDLRVYLFAVGVSLLCGLAAGLSPARFATGRAVAIASMAGSARGGPSLPTRRRSLLIGLQAGLAMLLLVVAVLFTRSALRMTTVDIGFDADRMLAVWPNAPRQDFDEALYTSMVVDAVRDLPGVEAVSVSQYAPFGFSQWRDRVMHDGQRVDVQRMAVDASFFATAGVRLVRGRTFTDDEVSREAPVAVISHTIARRFFRDQDPLGRSIAQIPTHTGEPRTDATVVGVVADSLLTRVEGEAFGSIFEPLSRARANPPNIIIRTARPDMTMRSVEQATRGIDPRVQILTTVVQDSIDEYLGVRRMLAWVLGPAAALSLALAGLGIYGVTSFVIGFRIEEVSVRMALGASPLEVLRLLVVDALRPVAAGLAAGFASALAFIRFVAIEELPGVSPYDPVSTGAALMTLLTCALVAAVLPARRAAQTNPADLLRQAS